MKKEFFEDKDKGVERGPGFYLREARLERKIGLEEMALRLCLDAGLLFDLEEENYKALPESVYVRGFIRAYAGELGLDAKALILLYKKTLRENDFLLKKNILEKSGRKAAGFVFFFLLLFSFSAFFFNLVFKFRLSPDAVPELIEEPEEEREAAGEPEKSLRYTLKVKGLENTWIKLIIDGAMPETFSLNPGSVLEFEAEKNYNLLVGSATGVELSLNGKNLPVYGSNGQVANLHFP